MSPYLLMSAVYLLLAVLMAADAALANFGLVPWFNGIRWLRIHVITLGAVSQALFGLLPALVAARHGAPRPKTRLDIWVLFNLGFVVLLAGIPIVNEALILLGGTLVFVAATLLLLELRSIRPAVPVPSDAAPGRGDGSGSLKFYAAGIGYLLVGIIIGTGYFLGWSPVLRIQVPLEAHIHANNWGFMSLAFAGLMIDMYPAWSGKQLARPRSLTPIFWLLTIGALGLVLGPWLRSALFSVPGILLFLAGTFWLLANVIKPLWGDGETWSRPGPWHLVTSYVWIVFPVLMAPMIVLGVEGFPGAEVEANAPQALVYGWVLQFGFAFVGYFFDRAFRPAARARLGGNWFSLLAVHTGGLLLWAGIFLPDIVGLVHGTAYTLWALASAPIAWATWQTLREGLAAAEHGTAEEPLLS